MLKGVRKYWVIAVICGLAASFLFYRYLQDVKTRYRPDDLVQVVRARAAINKDTVITAEQVEVESLPAKYVHPEALKDKRSVIGKIALNDITTGEEILKPKLVSSNDKAQRLSYSIPDSKRAVSIAIDSISGVGGYIRPGDRVDIIATLDIPLTDSSGNEKPKAFSILALQDIEVLAVGENPGVDTKKESSGGKTLTLAVSLQEAQPLVLASERGNLRLLLRSPIERSRAGLAPYQLKDFLNISGQ